MNYLIYKYNTILYCFEGHLTVHGLECIFL